VCIETLSLEVYLVYGTTTSKRVRVRVRVRVGAPYSPTLTLTLTPSLKLGYVRSKGLEMKIIFYFVLISGFSEPKFSRTKDVSTLQDNNVDNRKNGHFWNYVHYR
jgi:hypothetical protein